MAEEIDSFTKAYRDYIVAKGTPDSQNALDRCLHIWKTTYSELLANAEGDERKLVSSYCEKICKMI